MIFQLACGSCGIVSYVSDAFATIVWVCPSCQNVNRTSLPSDPTASSALFTGDTTGLTIVNGEDATVYDAAQEVLTEQAYFAQEND